MTDPVKESKTVPSEDTASSSPRDTLEMPVSKKDMKKAFRFNEIYTVVVAVVTAAVAVIVGYRVFISEAKAAGKEAAQVVAERQDKLETKQTEVQLDMRDLYKAVMYGRRSERLEREPVENPKDGGR